MTATFRRAPRLLMLLHGHLPGDSRVQSQIRAAVDAGFEVDVLALRRPGEPSTSEVDGARCYHLPVEHRRGRGVLRTMGEYAGFTALALAKAAVLARRRSYDVVQVHNPPDFLVLAASVPCLLGARLILDVHDLSSDMFGMRFGGRAGAASTERVLRTMERWAARASTAVITVHEPYRRELAARGTPLPKITVVMNSLDERLLPPGTGRVSPGETFVVAYHGTVTPHYGVELLVEAAALLRDRIPELRVHVYGEGDAVAELRRRARELELVDTLHLSDEHLPQRDVLEAVQRASVGVVPNLPTKLNRFALSTKLFEYVALGVPVVSSDLPTIREHFSDEEVSYFVAGDARSLADALLDVFERPEAAAARAAAARRRYASYRWTESARRYVDLLTRVASTRSRPDEPSSSPDEASRGALPHDDEPADLGQRKRS